MVSLVLFRRHWKVACLVLLAFFFGLYFGLHFGSPTVDHGINRSRDHPLTPNGPTSTDFNPKNNSQPLATDLPTPNENPTEPPTAIATEPPTSLPTSVPTDFPFAPSRFTELPHFVNFSRRTDLVFDETQAADRTILVYDVQWVPTVSAIVVIISDRIVPKSRVSLGEKPLNNSAFFPNVTVTAQSLGSSDNSHSGRVATVQCTDLEKHRPDGELWSDTMGLALSVVVCNLPIDFRDLVLAPSSNSAAIESLLVQFPDLTVQLALSNPTASKYFKRASRRNPPPITEPKRTVGACLVGTWRKSIQHAREIVQYHLTSGISHVYLSYTGDMVHGELVETRPSTIFSALRELEHLLADYISEGKVSVILAPGVHADIPSEDGYVDSCLWHSKAYDNYTAVLDFDEIVLINDTMKMNITTAIATFIEKQLARGKESPRCSMALDEFSTCRSEIDCVRYPMRETHFKLDRNHKSIALTQRAKYLGIHGHSKCMPLLPAEKQEKANGGIWDDTSVDSRAYLNELHDPERKFHLITYNFFIFHFVHMYGSRGFSCERPGGNTTNEYHEIWFGDVTRELERRCLSMDPLNNNTYIAEFCLKLRGPGTEKIRRVA